jgi:hypothetical protein
MTNNSEIILQENIPLNDEDFKYFETQQKAYKKTPIILSFCTLFTMTLIAWFIRDNFSSFHYYDYILFIAAGLALFAFGYFIAWLLNRYDNSNWKKDKSNGKSKLTSNVIKRDKTEYGEYLTFAGKSKNDNLRIKVKQQDYSHYQIGTKVEVTYLKFSKVALNLIKID